MKSAAHVARAHPHEAADKVLVAGNEGVTALAPPQRAQAAGHGSWQSLRGRGWRKAPNTKKHKNTGKTAVGEPDSQCALTF
jgi:hypothetical protein